MSLSWCEVTLQLLTLFMRVWWHCNTVLSEAILPCQFLWCFYLERVGWALLNTQGAAQRQTLLTLPSWFQIELCLLLSQDPRTLPARLHSSQGRRALLLSQSPSQQLPSPIRWENEGLRLSQGVLTWKGCLAGCWAIGAGMSVTWRGWSIYHTSVWSS